MADISKVRLGNTEYYLKDIVARQMAEEAGNDPGGDPGGSTGGGSGFEIVNTLPNSPTDGVLYLLRDGTDYTAYVHDNGEWRQILGTPAEGGDDDDGIVLEIVDELPSSHNANTLYLVPGDTESTYTAYVYNSGWKQIGGSGGSESAGSGIWYSESEDDEPPGGYDVWIIGGEGENEIPIPDISVERVAGGVKITADSGSGVTQETVYDGAPFAIKSYFDSLDDLEEAVPDPSEGAVYGVGMEAPYDLYVWDALHSEWVNNGSISGVQGPAGVSPVVSVTKNGSVTTITITDANGTHTATINDGQNGSPGTNGTNGNTPVKGTDYWTSADKAEIVQEVLDELPAWEGGSY